MSTLHFDPTIFETTQLSPTAEEFRRLIVHRVNLDDAAQAGTEVAQLVGSKSGIAVIDSSRSVICLPPGSGAEVDFWLFANGQTIVTHNNVDLRQIDRYPTLVSFCRAWNLKREAETELGVPHGILLANLKTHGAEEQFLDQLLDLGIGREEVILLDQEMPATDRMLKKTAGGKHRETGLALRVSRLEPLEGILMALRQPSHFEAPRAIFYDPNSQEDPEVEWPFKLELVAEMYRLAPQIKTIICCPSRWGRPEQIPGLATRLMYGGVKLNYIMTDLNLISAWAPHWEMTECVRL